MEGNHSPDFAQLDFENIYLAEEMPDSPVKGRRNPASAGGSTISALDLAAPRKAVMAFNKGLSLLKAQNSKAAIRYLQQAVSAYPNSYLLTELSDMPISIKGILAPGMNLKP